MQIAINIPNIQAIIALFRQAPEIVTPILENAIRESQIIMGEAKGQAQVPYATGKLTSNFFVKPITALSYAYGPVGVNYAGFVEFGTRPHIIRVVNAKVLANKAKNQIFGTIVHHPGTKPNPYMERIAAAALPQITTLFQEAEQTIIAALKTA